MKKLVLVGGSGSIGEQVIDIVRANPNEFELIGMAVGTRIDSLIKAANEFKIPNICVQREEDVVTVKNAVPNATVYFGNEGLNTLARIKCDLFVNALVGFVGMEPTINAIECGNDIALANKETLVVAGELVERKLNEHNVKLYPIDSEHSAIFQCLQGNKMDDVNSLIVTASGGSFRDKSREELKGVTKADALRHPNWSMGNKITIDSATMMNKGFEVIEAHYLFKLPYDKIRVILHRQSIIHSMVEYKDHSIIAQLGVSDMRIPIQYALTYPNRIDMKYDNQLDFMKYSNLTFEELSFERYPLLKLAYEVGEAKGILPCVMNAANEIAVGAFLSEKIGFLDVERIVIETVHHFENREYNSIDDLRNYDNKARNYALELIERC
ncbi:MAG: 1-deoxy-D-xylulose-5-phosphate reductoisomerase [Erysipelotrichales bacterium]|nr:1-deoxy-D-xylulose-5-phosphate reductoisomerase [Erysipelotrichales bacterium]